jgi:cytochrome P450
MTAGTENNDVDLSAEHYDPLVWNSLDDPFDALSEMRSKCPVAHSDAHGGFWNVLSYADLVAVSRDNSTFSNFRITIPDNPAPIPAPPLSTDPPVHQDYRGPLMSHFSPGAVSRLEAQIRKDTTALIDTIIESGAGDIAQAVCVPLPAITGMHFLSLPMEDLPQFKVWTDMIFTSTGDPYDALAEYFGGYYERLADSTVDDIPSVVRRLMIQGAPITELEYARTMTQLVGGALDTTANGASQTLLQLWRHPELRTRLIEDPSLLPLALEELLRFVSPLPGLSRLVKEDTEVGGQPVGPGDRLLLNYLAANHDPAEFEEPEEIILDRSPNRHVAFGIGAHRCIGAHLARLELRILLEEVFERLPDYRVLEDRIVRTTGFTRMITSLPIEFTPGSRRG